MTRTNRLRRVGILCCHCLRNLAFRNAGWRKGAFLLTEQFWINANGNFLDIAVLEWCKLFADTHGKHFWSKVVTQKQDFNRGLLKTLDATQADFEAYVQEVKTYRDKFIAHLDDDEIMQIPLLGFMRKSVSYLYDYILANEDDGNVFSDAPTNSGNHYSKYFKEGKAAYEELKQQA